MTDSIHPRVVAMLHATAKANNIANGRDEAILHSLQTLACDLVPDRNFFADVFSLAPGAEPITPRRIGEEFWRMASRSREARRLDGSFYTPPAVIDTILDLTWSRVAALSATICDPALGCGFFPLRIVERLAASPGVSRQGLRDWAGGHLFGCDIDPAAVFMTRALLWLALSDAETQFLPGCGNFTCGDALLGADFPMPEALTPSGSLSWPAAFPDVAEEGGFDVIVGNPPYEVLTNFGRRPERKALAIAIRGSGYYRDALHGQVNLYRCFIERSLSLLRQGGELSFVVPLSLARDAAAEPLRRRLLCLEGADEWRLYEEREEMFTGVTQAACIFRAVRGGGRAKRVKVGGVRGNAVVRLEELERFGDGGLGLPLLDGKGIKLWRWLWGNAKARVADAAEMRVGEVDQTFFRDCMRDDNTGCVLARGAHLRPFHLDIREEAGKERFLDVKRFLEKKGAAATACAERAGQWRVVQLGIRNMQSRPRLVSALVKPGVYLGNSLNVFFPKAGVSLRFLAGVLGSAVLDWLFCLGSGNNNINLHEIGSLPFPLDAGEDLVRAVEEAFAACSTIAAAGGDNGAARAELDVAVLRCYGVPLALCEPLQPAI